MPKCGANSGPAGDLSRDALGSGQARRLPAGEGPPQGDTKPRATRAPGSLARVTTRNEKLLFDKDTINRIKRLKNRLGEKTGGKNTCRTWRAIPNTHYVITVIPGALKIEKANNPGKGWMHGQRFGTWQGIRKKEGKLDFTRKSCKKSNDDTNIYLSD